MSAQAEEYIDILYNTRYGGYSLSKEAVQLYNEKSRDVKIYKGYTSGSDDEDEDKYDGSNKVYDDMIPRHDTILIEVFKELGSEKCSGKYCHLKMVTIPKKYQDFYKVCAYDGKESIRIDKNEYFLGQIKNIISGGGGGGKISADEKVRKIEELLRDEK